MEDLKLVLAVLAAGITSFGGSKIAVAVILTRLDAMAAQRKEDLIMLERQREEDKGSVERWMRRIETDIERLHNPRRRDREDQG